VIADSCWGLLFDAAAAIRADGGGIDLERALRRFEVINELPGRAVAAVLEAVVEYTDSQEALIAELRDDLDRAEAALDEPTEAA
jgi:hypothetical protein